MRILVTGGLGLNGAWIVQLLMQLGHDVTVLDSRPTDPLVERIATGVPVIVVDVTDEVAVRDVVQRHRIETIVHLAAATNKACKLDPGLAVRLNAGGTLAVLRAGVAGGVRRVVFASTGSVYAPFTGRHGHPTYAPIAESFRTSPLPFYRVYAQSKLFCEQLGLYMHDTTGLDFVALRFADIVAPGRSARRAGLAAIPVVEQMIMAAMDETPYILGHGADQGVDVLYVKDLAAGVVAAATAPGAVSGIYNIGSGSISTLRDVAAAIKSRLPRAQLRLTGGLDFLDRGPIYGLFDIRSARRRLGYAPAFSVATAIDDFIATRRWLGDL